MPPGPQEPPLPAPACRPPGAGGCPSHSLGVEHAPLYVSRDTLECNRGVCGEEWGQCQHQPADKNLNPSGPQLPDQLG